MDPIHRQHLLESESVKRGVERYRELVDKALDKNRELDTPPGERLLADILSTYVPAVIGLQREAKTKLRKTWADGGTLNGWELPLSVVSPHQAAVIAVRTILGEGPNKSKVQALSKRVGILVNVQLQFKEWRDHERKLTKDIPEHRNRIQLMCRRIKKLEVRSVRRWMRRVEDLEKTEWSNDVRVKVGAALISTLVAACPEVFEYSTVRVSVFGKKVSRKSIRLTEGTKATLEKRHNINALLQPWLMPMVCPPKPWSWNEADQTYTGAYISGSINLPVIKGTRWKHTAALLTGDIVPAGVLTALNRVQATPWKINKFVLSMIEAAFDRSLEDILPVAPVKDLPPKVKDNVWQRMTKEERGEVKHSREQIHAYNNRLASLREALVRKMALARDFAEEPVIYFPHNLDFRGRAYPIPQDFHPQSDDPARALLLFRDAKPLGEAGLDYLIWHLANCYGVDKASRLEQLQWVEAHNKQIIDTAMTPLDVKAREWWAQAADPWQFLAAAREYTEAVLSGDPEGYSSSLPVHVDGSCNGLQHLSAMALDPVGARATNLCAGLDRQDIYSIVSDKVLEKVKMDARRGPEDPRSAPARAWRGHVNRKVVKRAVMTVPYGVTDIGMRDQLITDRWTWDLAGSALENATYLRDRLREAIGETVVSAKRVMDWLQVSAHQLAKSGVPVQWTTPSGLTVRMAYHKMSFRYIRTLCGDGQFRVYMFDEDEQQGLLIRKQVLGSAPNIIHSFDAAHMMMTILAAEEIGSWSVIHDSFGSHAADMPLLQRTLRQTFIDIYSQDWFHKLALDFMAAAAHGGVNLPVPPARGTYDVEEVLSSRYFFA